MTLHPETESGLPLADHQMRDQIEEILRHDPSFDGSIIEPKSPENSEIPLSISSSFSLHNLESIKSLQENMNVLAIVATFLGSLQAQITAYPLSAQQNSISSPKKLSIAINILFFSGLLLDILGGCIAYIESLRLQRAYTLLLRQSKTMQEIMNEVENSAGQTTTNLSTLCLHIRFLDILFLHSLSPGAFSLVHRRKVCERAYRNILSSSTTLSNLSRQLSPALHSRLVFHLKEYTKTTRQLYHARATLSSSRLVIGVLPWILGTAVCCMVVGLLCFALDTYSGGSAAVWVVCFAAVGVILCGMGSLSAWTWLETRYY